VREHELKTSENTVLNILYHYETLSSYLEEKTLNANIQTSCEICFYDYDIFLSGHEELKYIGHAQNLCADYFV
jgi:hypothetical protein